MPRSLHIKHVATAIRRASSAPKTPRSRYPTSRASTEPAAAVAKATSTRKQLSPFIRQRALPWALSSLVAGAIGFYAVALLVQAMKPCSNPAISDLSQQKDVSNRYDEIADSFDSEVEFSERLMGVKKMRKQLAKKCTGHVLEVSCGTGRNLGYYDVNKEGNIASLTFVDLSPQMVEVCKKKWEVLFGGASTSDKDLKNKNLKPGLVVRFLAASALDSMPPPPTGKKYDTVVQTLGLCSTPSPHQLLLNIIDHLDTSNPEARVLLLEHGRSYREWLNNILDSNAEQHAEKLGCWWNRDIGALVEEAAQETGLQIDSERRHHFGTNWMIELKPGRELLNKNTSRSEPASEETQSQSVTWRSWLGLT